jgi:predicted oxidoreductase
MALVGTPLQARMKIPDTPELALRDWQRFGELDPDDTYPQQWARHYVEHSRAEVYDWLLREGVKFMPAVNWVERGLQGDGNSLPRYHIVWGTSRELTRRMIAALRDADKGVRLTVLHRHRVSALEYQGGKLAGAVAVDETTGANVHLQADVVLAMGGINGSHQEARANWPGDGPFRRPCSTAPTPTPTAPCTTGWQTTWAARSPMGEMWNYAAGFPHPYPHFEGHGLSTIPCKSALWLNHRGERIGPEPLVTGFDTHWLCQRVAVQEKPWTWHLLNWRIAAKEFAISGAEHNQRIRDKQFLAVPQGNPAGQPSAGQTDGGREPRLPGGRHAGRSGGQDERAHRLARRQSRGAAGDGRCLRCQLRPWQQVAQRRPDPPHPARAPMGAGQAAHLPPAPLQKRGAGPFIAIQMQLITRKSLGGLRTDLHSRVLDARGRPIGGLYCVGEAAGFGGGGASGKRSLEGTFLPGCILTARAAARSITTGR